jgi:hypothetical protein
VSSPGISAFVVPEPPPEGLTETAILAVTDERPFLRQVAGQCRRVQVWGAAHTVGIVSEPLHDVVDGEQVGAAGCSTELWVCQSDLAPLGGLVLARCGPTLDQSFPSTFGSFASEPRTGQHLAEQRMQLRGHPHPARQDRTKMLQ